MNPSEQIQKFIEALREPSMGQKEIVDLLTSVASLMIQFLMGVALIFFIISSIQMLTSGSNEAQAANAKKSMMYIVIGILIGVGALAGLNLLQSVFAAG